MATRQPNVGLERLYRESGWTLRQFAQEVNRTGTERGTPLRYREPSVHQWLKGHLPKEDVRPLILEALARRLRRPVTRSEAGLPPAPEDRQADHPSTVEGLLDLGRQDMDPSRRSVLGVGLFAVALTVPNHLTFCTTLRGMSVQAVDLGHGAEAMRLADAAAAASPKAGPRMRAFLAGQQAHAAAQTGERVAAQSFLREAEVAMEKAESQSTAFGSYDPSSLLYHMSQVKFELGDVAGSISAMQQSDKIRQSVYRRARVRHRCTLAERQLDMGHLEAACQTWTLALDDYPSLQSGRADDRIKTMHSRIKPYLKNHAARDLFERARLVTPPHLMPH